MAFATAGKHQSPTVFADVEMMEKGKKTMLECPVPFAVTLAAPRHPQVSGIGKKTTSHDGGPSLRLLEKAMLECPVPFAVTLAALGNPRVSGI